MALDVKHLGQLRFIAPGAREPRLGGPGSWRARVHSISRARSISRALDSGFGGVVGGEEQPEQVGEQGGATPVSLEGRGSSETWPFTDTTATSFV